MGKSAFYEASLAVLGAEHRGNGIGTLGEKTVHAVLKRYLEPDVTKHEVRVGPYVADILNDGGVVEVQTRQFGRMRKKLEYLLERGPVTMVYPISQVNWITWMNTESGETEPRRRSPKTGRPQEVFAQLDEIRPLLCHPNLRLRIVLLETQEVRHYAGLRRGQRRNPERWERLPCELFGELEFRCPADYLQLVPPELEEPFTSHDYARACRVPLTLSQASLRVLAQVGVVSRAGKRGNCLLYERVAFPQTDRTTSHVICLK